MEVVLKAGQAVAVEPPCLVRKYGVAEQSPTCDRQATHDEKGLANR